MAGLGADEAHHSGLRRESTAVKKLQVICFTDLTILFGDNVIWRSVPEGLGGGAAATVSSQCWSGARQQAMVSDDADVHLVLVFI